MEIALIIINSFISLSFLGSAIKMAKMKYRKSYILRAVAVSFAIAANVAYLWLQV